MFADALHRRRDVHVRQVVAKGERFGADDSHPLTNHQACHSAESGQLPIVAVVPGSGERTVGDAADPLLHGYHILAVERAVSGKNCRNADVLQYPSIEKFKPGNRTHIREFASRKSISPDLRYAIRDVEVGHGDARLECRLANSFDTVRDIYLLQREATGEQAVANILHAWRQRNMMKAVFVLEQPAGDTTDARIP